MASSKAATVDEYLAELPEERRAVVSAVRDVVRRNLPAGYRETMSYGMITYCIPLADYPDTYNKQPLGYAALAAQKKHYALYLNCVYQDPEQERRLREAFEKAGKKMDVGKSCLRFKKLDDLPLDAIGRLIAGTPPERFIAQYEAARPGRRGARKMSGATEGLVYTHATWRVIPGREDAFIAAWTELADAFTALPAQPLWGTLIRSAADPSVFFSFGPWRGAADVQAMRADPRAQQAMAAVRALCVEATPEPCSLVRHVQLAPAAE